MSSTRNENFANAPINFDMDELEKKTPEELDRILKQMDDYTKRSLSQAQSYQ